LQSAFFVLFVPVDFHLRDGPGTDYATRARFAITFETPDGAGEKYENARNNLLSWAIRSTFTATAGMGKTKATAAYSTRSAKRVRRKFERKTRRTISVSVNRNAQHRSAERSRFPCTVFYIFIYFFSFFITARLSVCGRASATALRFGRESMRNIWTRVLRNSNEYTMPHGRPRSMWTWISRRCVRLRFLSRSTRK
jgi:hypothetical protein